jgi:hypothetical protein
MAFSPEILIFLFFMITDPRTMPLGRRARVAYAAAVAFVAAMLAATARSEFATKLAVLGGLTLVCALRPVLERVLPATAETQAPRAGSSSWRHRRPSRPVVAVIAGLCALVAGADLLVLAGGRTPMAAASSVEAAGPGAAGPTPSIHLPPVTVDPAVGTAGAAVTPALARAMAADLVAALAASAPPSYRFDRLTVVLVRDPSNSQAPPVVGIHAVGTVAGSGGPAAGPAPFDGTFAMAPAAGRYVITARS